MSKGTEMYMIKKTCTNYEAHLNKAQLHLSLAQTCPGSGLDASSSTLQSTAICCGYSCSSLTGNTALILVAHLL